MNRLCPALFGTDSALVIGGILLPPATARARADTPPDVQVLTRGPVQEAFAETVSFDPQPGLIVRAAPRIVIAINVFANHLFVRPRCGRYYFGDYYAPRYRADGYHASFFWHTGYRGNDPICAYDRWQPGGERDWESRRHADFDFFRDHEDVRPRHTWAAMREVVNSHHQDGRNRVFATPLDSITRTPANGPRFRTLDRGRREQLVSQSRKIRDFGQARNQMETRGSDASGRSHQPTTRQAPQRRAQPTPQRQARPSTQSTAPDGRGPTRGRSR